MKSQQRKRNRKNPTVGYSTTTSFISIFLKHSMMMNNYVGLWLRISAKSLIDILLLCCNWIKLEMCFYNLKLSCVHLHTHKIVFYSKKTNIDESQRQSQKAGGMMKKTIVLVSMYMCSTVSWQQMEHVPSKWKLVESVKITSIYLNGELIFSAIYS